MGPKNDWISAISWKNITINHIETWKLSHRVLTVNRKIARIQTKGFLRNNELKKNLRDFGQTVRLSRSPQGPKENRKPLEERIWEMELYKAEQGQKPFATVEKQTRHWAIGDASKNIARVRRAEENPKPIIRQVHIFLICRLIQKYQNFMK